MRKKALLAAVAASVIAVAVAPALAATADEIAALKAQSAALTKQNAALEKRLNRIEKQQAREQAEMARQPAARPATTSFVADLPSLKGPAGCAPLNLDGPLTFCGITIFGTIDAGVGYVSHGLPENGQNYEGESLVNKFTNHPYWGIAQNNLSQTTLGVKGEEELLPGLAGVFMASTGINPQSGQLANMPGTMVSNQGLPRSAYSFSGDGGRGGQPFNDQLYVGLASPEFGQLTVGRHRPFSTDLMVEYDPAAGAYAFSPIAYNGQLLQGLGATEDARWDDLLKYRVTYGPVRFGAMYKFEDGTAGCNYLGTLTSPSGTPQTCYTPHNDAGQLTLGGSYGGFDIDGVVGFYHQAVVMAGGNSPLSAAQLTSSTFVNTLGQTVVSTGNNLNTLQANISDDAGAAIGVKYTWNQFKFFAGFDNEVLQNPKDNLGIGADNDEGGYLLSQVNNDNYYHARVLQTVWVGVKYAYDPKTDFTVGYYHTYQNQFGSPTVVATCATATTQSAKPGECSGTLDVASAFVDYHFTKRFDAYGGLEVSAVNGGLASGYNYYTNWAPVVGARFTF